MTECLCQCHVSPHTHAPCCPTHKLPLYAAEPLYAEAGNGQCPWVGAETFTRQHRGGMSFAPKRCITWGPRNWLWIPRDVFHGDDLPPHNGHRAPRYPAPGGPVWELHSHRCKACKALTSHVVGDNRSVCTGCGTASWVPDPQYVNGAAS